jgi:glucosylceramidase
MKKMLTTAILVVFAMNVQAQTTAVSFHSSNGNYWHMKTESVTDNVGTAQIVINTAEPQQTFKGWGTCFNELDYDAWSLLSETDRTLFTKRLFNPNGDLRLGVGRISVGASDYACDWYSCDETSYDGTNSDGTLNYATDFTMEHFTIDRDRQKVIPSIKQALAENPDMTFWASPWSPPQWMKTNKHYAQRVTNTNGCPFGVAPYDNDQFIDDERYYNAYCLYFDKFIQAYKAEGINITALAYQNEAYSNTPYPGCSWKAATTGKFLGQYLGPYMAEHQPDLTLIVGTMNTNRYDVFKTILESPGVSTYCKQVGFQWEGGQQIANIRRDYPDFELVQTESECGSGTFDWNAAAHTFQLCNHYLANGVTTYTYWNAILKDNGASNWGWIQNALVQVSSATNTAKYCPEYYAYKHYTHLIPAGSKILTCDEANLLTSALTPDGNVVIVVGNNGSTDKTLTVSIDGKLVVCKVQAKSFATYVVGTESTVAKMLKSEAQGLVDIEGASLTDSQAAALESAIAEGTCKALTAAVLGAAAEGSIVNPSFTSKADGWTVANVAASGDFRAATVLGKTCYNNWSNNFTSLDIHQDVMGLPEGLYTLSAKSVCGEGNITDQHVYAETTTHLVTSPVKQDDVWNANNWETQTTQTIYLAPGDVLRVGYASTSGGGTKGWFCVTDFELTRVGDLTADFDLDANRKTGELEAAKEAWRTVVEAAQQLAADERYDEQLRSDLQTLIASQQTQIDGLTESALVGNLQRQLQQLMDEVSAHPSAAYIRRTGDATFTVQSAAINASTTSGWLRDNNNAAGYSEQPAAIQSSVHTGYGISHWRGSAISNSRLIYQTIDNLPAGVYTLQGYAAATVWNNNNGNDNRTGVSLFAAGETTSAETAVTTATYGEYTVTYTLSEGEPLTIGLRAGANNGNNWIFLSDVTLSYQPLTVTIDEAQTTPAALAAGVDVQLVRTLSADYWNTLCLPFSLTTDQVAAAFGDDVELKQYDSVEGNTMNFTDAVDGIEAAKPYLVKPAADVVNPTFENVSITATDGTTDGTGITFTGLLCQKGCADLGQGAAYLATDASIKKLAADAALKGLRAYFNVANDIAGARISINGTPTDIRSIDAGGQGDAVPTTYRLNGLQSRPDRQGIYVSQGKKFIVK